MNKLFNKIATGIVGIALAIGVGVAAGGKGNKATRVYGTSEEITAATFDFEESTAHHVYAQGTSDNDFSEGPKYYTEHSTNDITLGYADSTTSGSPKQGSTAHVVARVAKKTTNSPYVIVGPVDLSDYNVMGISYMAKGPTTITVTSYYSTDNGTNWTQLESHTSTTSYATYGSATNLSGASPSKTISQPDSLLFKVQGTVPSSVSGSHRDLCVDDIKFYGESATPSSFTVSFDVAGDSSGYGTVYPSSIENVPSGSNITVSNNTVTINGSIVTATPTTNTAQYTYAFTGWDNTSGTITAARTITANFSRTTNTFTVGGTINHGSLSSTENVEYGSALNITISADSGYSLPDTLTSVTMGKSTPAYTYNSGTGAFSIASVTGNVVINATCPPQGTSYQVTYDANGGASVASEQIIENGHPTFPVTTKSGYAFKGWQVGGTGTIYTSDNAEDYTVTAAVTFVAKWAALYAVTFDSDGGSESPTAKSIEDGTTFTFPSAGTKAHYSFAGWSSTGSEPYYAAGATSPAVTAAINYTAHWIADPQYTVTYTANEDGTGSYIHASQWSGAYTLLPYDDIKGDTKVQANSGYRFKHYTVGGVLKKPGDTITLSAATTVIVVFEEQPVTDLLRTASTSLNYSSSSYGSVSGITKSQSDINSECTYAGYLLCATSPRAGAIQLNPNKSTFICTTASSQYIDSISISFNDTNNNGIKFYGSNTAYTATYNASGSDSSTLLHTSTSSDSFTVTSDYKYLYIVPTGTTYVDSITVLWKAIPQLRSVTTVGQTASFYNNQTFAYGGTLTAHYTQGKADATVTPTKYKFGDEGINPDSAGTLITTSTVLSIATYNGKYIYVGYTEDGITKWTSGYQISVTYKGATGISLDKDTVDGLAVGATVDLTATVTDQYADPNAVTWTSSSPSVATVSAESGTKTITVTGVAAGTTTITATANGYSDTCEVTVTDVPSLNLFDSSDEKINDATLNHFTGDSTVTIHAVAENITSPTFVWDNEDDSVVTISATTSTCVVTIVGAGNSEVSVTVGSLTQVVTFSVTGSAVTALTLTSSVVSGEIWDGTYLNTLTLTPSITLVGNATNVINWSSDNTSVATVSSASTSGAAITVTGKSEGTATITATSAYTPSVYAEYEVTVKADGVTNLSWTKRPKFNSGASGFQKIWAGETTLGNLISQNGSDGIGVFAPTWKSTKTDSPTMGTGAHDVHIVISTSATPTSEAGLTPLTSNYVFQASDNGKYVVAFYEGKASGYNTQLSVTKWRSVIEDNTMTETFDYSDGELDQSGDITTSSIVTGGFTDVGSDSIRLGSGSRTGSLTITSATNLISKIEVWVKSYGTDSASLNVGTRNTGTIGSDKFYKFEYTFDDPVSSIAMSTTANSKRVYVQKVVITSGGENQIGKTDDCVGLEEYIDTYLHMDKDVAGQCIEYYGKNTETGAKYFFNQLNDHQKELLTTNSAYTAEWARLSAWAAANGESLNTTTNTLSASRISPLANVLGDNPNAALVVIIVSMVSIAAIGGYFFLRKKKED